MIGGAQGAVRPADPDDRRAWLQEGLVKIVDVLFVAGECQYSLRIDDALVLIVGKLSKHPIREGRNVTRVGDKHVLKLNFIVHLASLIRLIGEDLRASIRGV